MEPFQQYRKLSIQDSQEGSQHCNIQNLINFPNGSTQNEIQTMLKKQFDKNQNLDELINFSFRSHNIALSNASKKFLSQKFPKLQQPKISNFYENQCFINLNSLGLWFKKSQDKFPIQHIPPIPKQLKSLLDNLHNQYGYIPNLERFLLFYPTYLQKHMHLYKSLFEAHQINLVLLNFVGICAASQIGSVYMITRLVKKFIKEGGNIQWISKESYPAQYKQILILVRKFARCPWQINNELLQNTINTEIWTSKQLAYLFITICFIIQLSTISLAMGLIPEQKIDCLNIQEIQHYKKTYDKTIYETCPYERLSSIMDVLQVEFKQKQKDKVSKKSLKKSFRKIENEEKIEGYMKEIGTDLRQQQLYKLVNKCLKPILPKWTLIEKRNEAKNPPFDYYDCNFKSHIYPVLNSLVSDLAVLLLDLIEYSQCMTSNNFGSQNLGQRNTIAFRKAIRYYAQNISGYTHLQYNYKDNINKYITMPLKFYIRLLNFSPIHITNQVINEIKHQQGQIDCFDKGHVAVIVANTKMSFSLMMGMQSFCTEIFM